MRRILFILTTFLFVAITACNNTDKKSDDAAIEHQKIQADSLEKEVLEGHNEAMPKSMKIPALQKETQRLIDSISKLPAKAQQEAAPYKEKLKSLLKDLDDAGNAMNKWMAEFNYDSAKDNLVQRIKYLADEKLRVGKVKEAVLGSLQKADSLIKTKF
jgi:hypothetical protein